MKCVFLISFLLFISSHLRLQSQELFFEQVIGNGEMPNTSIHGIAKDSMGYIWIGSWHGLYRYDGAEFEVFRHSNSTLHSLPSNRIRNVITDDNKQLWVLTFDNQYLKYDYRLSHFITVEDSIVPNNVSVLLNSSSNLLNKSTIINGYRFIKESNHLTSVNLSTKVHKAYSSNLKQPGGLADDYVTSFYIDNQQIIWIGTRSGTLYKANTNRKPFNLFHLYADRRSELKPTPVRVIFKDKHQFWLGTNHNGLVLKNAQNQTSFPLKDTPYEEDQIRSIEKDIQGNLWIGGAHGLGYINADSKTYTPLFVKGLTPDKVVSVYDIDNALDKRYLWAAVFNTLLKFDIKSKQYEEIFIGDIIGNKSIMSIAEDSEGRLWLATEGKGIIRLTLNKSAKCIDTLVINTKTTIPNSEPLTGNLVYAIHIDKNNNIWAGTSEGLNYINHNTLSIKQITKANGISDNYIAAITEDKNGDIWLAHKKGISRISPPSFDISNYPVKTGNRTWTFLDGACYNDTANNILYFGATQGYISFNPDEIKKNPHLPSVEILKLYIADKEILPQHKIAGCTILEKSLALTKRIELNYNNRDFSIKVSALHYERPESNQVIYKLAGYDATWHTSTHNMLSYSKIPAGEYTLKVKAITPDGVESAEKQLIIKILSPWYASAWAIAGYIVFILLILFLTYREILIRERLKNRILLERINIEKKEELNRDRIEFFTNVSHELRTPLTLLTDPIKQLKNRELSEVKKTNYLDMISRNLEHLSTLINQLLDFRKVETGKLKADYSIEDVIKLVKQCTESFYMNANNRNIDLRFSSNRDKLLCYIDRNKVEQILFNLISNAFKYTSNGGNIWVQINAEEFTNAFVIEIKDNGIGIDATSLNKVFEPFNTVGNTPFDGNSSGIGLALTRNLITVLNGDISLNSEPQKGTTVTVTLPFKSVTEQDMTSNTEKILEQEIIEPQKEEVLDNKPMILIVEDNKDVQEYLKSELEDDYNIYQEFNGIDGLKAAIKIIPDIIISDVMMPFMDGVALCKEVKTALQTSHIPLILLTAKSAEESKIEGLNTGADYYISKPFSIEVLKAQLHSIVENRVKLQKALAGEKHLSALEEVNNGIDNEFMERTIEIIHKNISLTSFNNQELADQLAISQRQLYRKIKALSGSTIQEFIIRVKMDEAVKLLLNTSKTVSEISYSLGFSEPSNFSRTFTKHYGKSPTKWLKANK